MNIDISGLVGISAGVITALGGVWSLYRHIRYSIQAKKDKERESILSEARQAMFKIEAELEEKIRRLEIELEAQKLNVSRDLEHMKDIYNAEIKVLADKIDLLRQDLADQHSNMVALLTQLVSSK